jgi:hypothetical protein
MAADGVESCAGLICISFWTTGGIWVGLEVGIEVQNYRVVIVIMRIPRYMLRRFCLGVFQRLLAGLILVGDRHCRNTRNQGTGTMMICIDNGSVMFNLEDGWSLEQTVKRTAWNAEAVSAK